MGTSFHIALNELVLEDDAFVGSKYQGPFPSPSLHQGAKEKRTGSGLMVSNYPWRCLLF